MEMLYYKLIQHMYSGLWPPHVDIDEIERELELKHDWPSQRIASKKKYLIDGADVEFVSCGQYGVRAN
jgi:hypothetical protein